MKPLVSLDIEDAPTASAPPPPAWLGKGLLAAAGAYGLLFLAWLVLGTVLKPYSDAYNFIFDAWRWKDGAEPFIPYLWRPHVGHHMVWVRLVAAVEVTTAHSAWPSVVACTVALLAAAALLGWGAWKDGRLTWSRAPSALLCAMLPLTGFNALDADQPLNALYPYCLVFSVAALFLFAFAEGSRAGTMRGWACAAAVAAALGNGAALALWPILVLLAFLQPSGRLLWAGIAAVVGIVFGALYLSGAGQIADLGLGGGGPDADPVRRVLYLFDYIALPWAQVSALGGAALGVVICAVAGWAVRIALLRGLTPVDRFALGLIAFTLVTALLAAIGRGGLGAELKTPMRYAVFAAPLQAGVVMLLAPELERWRTRRHALAYLPLALAGLLLLQQFAGGYFVLKSASTIRSTIADYERGLRTPIMTQLIYPDMPFADAVERRLRAEGSFGKAPQELAQPAALGPAPSAGTRTP